MNDPLISVIIPVYKAQAYLERCVGSIRNQTYRNLEIILVDDGSPDESGAMCDQFAQEDSRIRVIHKENGGPASARNAGLDAMTGEYVTFVDSDDHIDPLMYRELYQLSVEHGADIACCGIVKVNDQVTCGYFNDNLEDFLLLSRAEAMGELLKNYRITDSLCDKLYRKGIFDRVRMAEGMLFEDVDVIYRCIREADRVVYTGKPLYRYYQSQGSIMRGVFDIRQFDVIKASRNRVNYYRQEYPEHLDLAYAKYVEVALEVLYRSRGVREYQPMRNDLTKELKQILKDHPNLPMTRNNRIKVFFFRLSLPVFVAFISVYHRINGTQR